MASHIHAKMASDGTGRDAYIVQEDAVRYGREFLHQANYGKGLFTSWDLRNVQVRVDTPRRNFPSTRRGGSGWASSLHNDERRRVHESLVHVEAQASDSLPSLGTTPKATPRRALGAKSHRYATGGPLPHELATSRRAQSPKVPKAAPKKGMPAMVLDLLEF